MSKPYLTEIDVPRPGALGGGTWALRRMTGITVLFGKNGSGKSQLLRAWRDQDPASTHYVVPERTGELDYQPQYTSQQISATERRGVSARNFATEYRRQVIVRIQAYLSVRGNYRGGAAPGSPDEIERCIQQLIPDFTFEIIPTQNPPYRIVRVATGSPIANIDELSSGEAQLLLLGLDVLTIAAMWEIQQTGRRILLIDEPDPHLHYDLQTRLADVLVAAAERFELQVIIATHSTALLAALGHFGGSHTSLVYLDRLKSQWSATAFSKNLKDMVSC